MHCKVYESHLNKAVIKKLKNNTGAKHPLPPPISCGHSLCSLWGIICPASLPPGWFGRRSLQGKRSQNNSHSMCTLKQAVAEVKVTQTSIQNQYSTYQNLSNTNRVNFQIYYENLGAFMPFWWVYKLARSRG